MSSDITRERIRGALASVLYPLARILLRCGVGYPEFAELAKHAYVEAASGEGGTLARSANVTRTALVTGLSRKEVMRIKNCDSKEQNRRINDHMTTPAAVLNAWHSDRRYCDRSGVPKVLDYSGSDHSFCSLVKNLSRDGSASVIRSELIRAGAVRTVGKNGLMAIKRHYVPDGADNKILVGLDFGLGRLAETIDFNSEKGYMYGARFQRFVQAPPIRFIDAPEIRKQVQFMLTDFSLKVDDLMASFQARSEKRGNKKNGKRFVNMGVGLYYFDDLSE